MNQTLRTALKSLVVGTALAGGMFAAQPSMATVGAISKLDMFGSWQLTLVGTTGCGPSAMLVNFALNSAGVANNATIVTHGQCGDSTVTGQTFTITSLGFNGAGTANLSCGVGCGWNLNFQLSPDRGSFNAVDVDPINPGNYIEGVGVHQ